MVNYLSLLGWNDGTEKEIYSVDELQTAFELERITKVRGPPPLLHWRCIGLAFQAKKSHFFFISLQRNTHIQPNPIQLKPNPPQYPPVPRRL